MCNLLFNCVTCLLHCTHSFNDRTRPVTIYVFCCGQGWCAVIRQSFYFAHTHTHTHTHQTSTSATLTAHPSVQRLLFPSPPPLPPSETLLTPTSTPVPPSSFTASQLFPNGLNSFSLPAHLEALKEEGGNQVTSLCVSYPQLLRLLRLVAVMKSL